MILDIDPGILKFELLVQLINEGLILQIIIWDDYIVNKKVLIPSLVMAVISFI